MMRRSLFYPFCIGAALFMAASCASIGNPSGGPRDEDPPRFLTSTPLQGETEVNPSKITLTFDELVALKDAFSKVVMSPPQSQTPRVSSQGRKVTVEVRDTLLPNTTYTIDFGDAIVDNNEGNRLENFIYTFSTGPVLDSLMVSGMVLGAEDLDPAKGIYVGLHSNLADSAFTGSRFERIAKTDDKGKFVIGGLSPGKYRIYALDDRDGDLAWSSPEETLAFYDAVIEPRAEGAIATDTIFNLLTGEVDSIVSRGRTRFVPNNILLRSFNTGYRPQYITKYERPDTARLSFTFNAPADTAPSFDLLMPDGINLALEDIAVTERSKNNDSITFWLTRKDLIATDTFRVAVKYFRGDSLFRPTAVFDTLRMIAPKPVAKSGGTDKKAGSKSKINAESDSIAPAIPLIPIKILTSKPEINSGIILEVDQPLDSIDLRKVYLQVRQDSLMVPLNDFGPPNISFDTLNPRLFRVDYPWEYGSSYSLIIDSLAGKGIYGLFTDKLTHEFSIRPEAEYSSLQFNVNNAGSDTVPKFVQLLDASGNPLVSSAVEEGKVLFEHLLSGKYNARIIVDFNGNGKWDPGVFETGQLPDVSYYYPTTIDLKSNWSQEIDWDVFSLPVDKMKPASLRKNTKNQ